MNKQLLKIIHNLHLPFILLLLLSGISLFMPTSRTFFNELQFPLIKFHIILGIIYIFYCLFILYLVIKYAKTKPSLNKFNVFFNIALFALWTISGLIMEYYELLQVHISIRNYSVVVHDYTTFIAIPWILVHGIGHLFSKRMPWPRWWQGKAPKPAWVEENIPY